MTQLDLYSTTAPAADVAPKGDRIGRLLVEPVDGVPGYPWCAHSSLPYTGWIHFFATRNEAIQEARAMVAGGILEADVEAVCRAMRAKCGETPDDVGDRAADVLLQRAADPRNISAAEMLDPVIAAIYRTLDEDAWGAAKAIAIARALNSGRIVDGPGGKRASQQLRRLERLVDHEHRARGRK